MTTSYVMTLVAQGGTQIFEGTAVVDNITSEIIAIYDYALPPDTNVLLPKDNSAYDTADNIYPLDGAGVNFYSDFIEGYYDVTFNNFNLYQEVGEYLLFNQQYGGDIASLQSATFVLIPDPSCFVRNSTILCKNQDNNDEVIEVPIQDLQPGQLVKTFKHGFRKVRQVGSQQIITNTNYFNTSLYSPITSSSSALSSSSSSSALSLVLTGGHGILLDDDNNYYQHYHKKNMELFNKAEADEPHYIDGKCITIVAATATAASDETPHQKPLYKQLPSHGETVQVFNFTLCAEKFEDADNCCFGVYATNANNTHLVAIPSHNEFIQHKYDNII